MWTDALTPCWVKAKAAGRLGRRRHERSRDFCCLLGLGGPKQAFAKIATPLLQTLTRTTALDALASAQSPHELKDAWQRVQSNLPFLIDETGSIKDLKNLVLFLAIRGLLSKQNSESDDKEKIRKALKMKRAELSENKVIKNQKKSAPISEEELPFKLPLGWYWSRFQDVSICRDGQRIPLSKENRSIRQGKYDYYGASGVIDKIDDYIFDETLLLIGEDGANLINRSTPIAFLAVGKYWVNNHAHVIDSYSTLGLKYLELFINAINLKPYITGTAQPKMNQAKMNSIVVAMPPLEEQQRIVEIVENLLSTCDRLENQLNKANQIAKNLSKTAIASIAGIEIKGVEKVKIPKTELVSTLRLKASPTNKDLAPLSAILAKHNGELSSKALWNYSGMKIDEFYQQLKTEMARDWIVEPEKARMIEKDADNQSGAEAG